MIIFTFLLIVFSVFFILILFFEFLDDYLAGNSKNKFSKNRLFWCKKCGDFYFESSAEDVCVCKKCGERNVKLNF